MVTMRLFTLLLCCVLSANCFAENLRIAVAANFAKPIEKLVAEFNKNHPFNAQISVASTGILFQQISHGAPFDIFLAADAKRPTLLVQQGLTIPGYHHTYAIGQLALWSATISTPITIENLRLHQGRIAIANPKIAPYGLAAKQALESLNLWQKYQHNLIVGTNIGQTYQQAKTGAIDYGIVAYSQWVQSKDGNGILIPNALHAPLKQEMAVLKQGPNNELAKEFYQFMLTDKAQQIISEMGYLAVSTPASTVENGI